MPYTIQNETLQRILKKYDDTKQLSAYFFLNKTINAFRELSKQYNGTDAIVANEILSIILRHQWSEEIETVADTCVARILAKIFNADFDIERNFPAELLRSIRIMARYSLLNDLEHAEANFTVITQYAGQYAKAIAQALECLQSAGLLTSEHAQANFTAITQGGGKYTRDIAMALERLQSAGLLAGEHAQANRDAITQGGGQYAWDIAMALGSLQRAGLLTGEHAQATLYAITQGGGQYAKAIAQALGSLHWAGLLTSEHAQANFTAITQGGGQYAWDIAIALERLHWAGLLTSEHAQANHDAITQGGGQYAKAIAQALGSLQRAGLLTSEHAQANRDAITQGGGQYARDIIEALECLQRAGLLTSEHAQKNVDFLFRYVRLSKNNYGIKFAVKCMKNLTQERFSLLMLDESVSIGKEQFAFFSEIFSFVVPEEEDINDKKFDYLALVKPMMRLHEYIHTYFSDKEQPEVLGYFIDMLKSSYFAMDYSTELFSHLSQNFYHRGDFLILMSDENSPIKPMILAILEMLAKSRNPDASFSEDSCMMINKLLFTSPLLSNTDMYMPCAQETKTEESEHQLPEPLDEESFPVNERIVTLLLISIYRSPETFKTACSLLSHLSVPTQLTRFSAAFNNASLFQRSSEDVPESCVNVPAVMR
jgi:predicted transcriptional regulator